MEITQKQIKKGQLMYILEAAFEYLISILVATSYLAKLTSFLGFSDALTGILSSVISLGCLFQLLSITFNRARVKPFVIVMSILNQLLFMLLYVIPVIPLEQKHKTIIFVVFIFGAYLLYNFAHPKKINWLMSLVDDKHRGDFTANKEIVSLISGMVFSFLMGTAIDHYTEIGKTKTAFIICGIVIFVLMLAHTYTLVRAVEKPIDKTGSQSLLITIKGIVKNKNIRKVTVVFVLYYVAKHSCESFYGTYYINELGFSLKFISLITIAGSISRILVSKFWGRYADKKSFADMIEKCFIILIACYLIAACTVPKNAYILFPLYTVLHGIAMGGINSALINLIFDYVAPQKRADSLAVCQAVSGVFGFLATLVFSRLVAYIQGSGNTLFGISVYAQQAVSVIGLIFILITIFCIRVFFKRNKSK